MGFGKRIALLVVLFGCWSAVAPNVAQADDKKAASVWVNDESSDRRFHDPEAGLTVLFNDKHTVMHRRQEVDGQAPQVDETKVLSRWELHKVRAADKRQQRKIASGQKLAEQGRSTGNESKELRGERRVTAAGTPQTEVALYHGGVQTTLVRTDKELVPSRTSVPESDRSFRVFHHDDDKHEHWVEVARGDAHRERVGDEISGGNLQEVDYRVRTMNRAGKVLGVQTVRRVEAVGGIYRHPHGTLEPVAKPLATASAARR